jgi:hypothetical protein
MQSVKLLANTPGELQCMPVDGFHLRVIYLTLAFWQSVCHSLRFLFFGSRICSQLGIED